MNKDRKKIASQKKKVASFKKMKPTYEQSKIVAGKFMATMTKEQFLTEFRAAVQEIWKNRYEQENIFIKAVGEGQYNYINVYLSTDPDMQRHQLENFFPRLFVELFAELYMQMHSKTFLKQPKSAVEATRAAQLEYNRLKSEACCIIL